MHYILHDCFVLSHGKHILVTIIIALFDRYLPSRGNPHDTGTHKTPVEHSRLDTIQPYDLNKYVVMYAFHKFDIDMIMI